MTLTTFVFENIYIEYFCHCNQKIVVHLLFPLSDVFMISVYFLFFFNKKLFKKVKILITSIRMCIDNFNHFFFQKILEKPRSYFLIQIKKQTCKPEKPEKHFGKQTECPKSKK